jgi:hypothetical protein
VETKLPSSGVSTPPPKPQTPARLDLHKSYAWWMVGGVHGLTGVLVLSPVKMVCKHMFAPAHTHRSNMAARLAKAQILKHDLAPRAFAPLTVSTVNGPNGRFATRPVEGALENEQGHANLLNMAGETVWESSCKKKNATGRRVSLMEFGLPGQNGENVRQSAV